MMASRKIEDLHEQTRAKVEKLMTILDLLGIKYKLLDTYRSNAEQQTLWNQGRTTAGPIVTRALPGRSFHNCRRAADFSLRDSDEDFDTADIVFSNSTVAADTWVRLGYLAELCGLAWGGRWVRQDRPHVEDHFCALCRREVGPTEADHFNERGECVLEGDA